MPVMRLCKLFIYECERTRVKFVHSDLVLNLNITAHITNSAAVVQHAVHCSPLLSYVIATQQPKLHSRA